MSTWDQVAQQLLDAAHASGVTVDREFIAPGPNFARDCRLLAVAFLRPAVVPVQREWAGSCAVVPQHVFQVVFAADCVPAQDDDGNPPTAAEVTAWSTAFLADCTRVFDALTDAATLGTIAGGCENVSIGQGEMRGPGGGMSSMVVPVTIQMMDEGE